MLGYDDIFDQLIDEHDEVKDLLNQATSCPENKRKGLVEAIEEALIPHARAEEKTLYAVLNQRAREEEDVEAMTITEEAYEEHRLVDKLLGDLKEKPVSDSNWLGLLLVIKENIEHHIEEEEDQLFEMADQLLSEEELIEIFENYQDRKEGFKDTLPTQAQIAERTPSQPLKKAM